MIKYTLLFINGLFMLLYHFLVGDAVQLNPKFPENAKANTEFVAEIQVNKSTVTGFAKLQIELPEGLTAKEFENKGSTFSFTNGITKFIWASLPAEETFTIKFKVVADANCNGPKEIKGKFSYLLNNEKKQVEFGPIKVNYSQEIQAASATPNSKESTGEFNPVKNSTEPVSMQRRVSPAGDNIFKVEVVFFKENIVGFAKHTEKIPDGFIAKEQNSAGGSFSSNQTFVKFLWASLSDKPELRISYLIERKAITTGASVIKGEFIYLDAEDTKKIYSDETEVPAASAEFISAATTNSAATVNNAVASGTNTNSTPTQNNVTSVKTDTNRNPDSNSSGEKSSVEATVSSQVVNSTKTTANEKTDVTQEQPIAGASAGKEEQVDAKAKQNQTTSRQEKPTASSQESTPTLVKDSKKTVKLAEGVAFQIQIGAFKKNVAASELAGQLGLTEQINSEMHEGLNKYLIGNYAEYKEARNKREGLRTGNVKDAFVAAYNSGKRITVQEALMITSQKWLR